MEKLKKRIARLLPAISMMCLLLSASSCLQSNENRRYQDLQEAVNTVDVPDSLKAEINAMSFKEFLRNNPLKRETAKLHAEVLNEKAIGDSIWDDLISRKKVEFEPIREKYRNKVDILRIKRIWLNGDLLPWTYHAWLTVSSHYSGRYSGTIKPNMSGYAKYTGETKLDYINVVFSDNSYKRFLIKDNPEWLLAREGEKVERRYEVNDYEVGTDVGRILEKDAFDLVVDVTYVPLFK